MNDGERRRRTIASERPEAMTARRVRKRQTDVVLLLLL